MNETNVSFLIKCRKALCTSLHANLTLHPNLSNADSWSRVPSSIVRSETGLGVGAPPKSFDLPYKAFCSCFPLIQKPSSILILICDTHLRPYIAAQPFETIATHVRTDYSSHVFLAFCAWFSSQPAAAQRPNLQLARSHGHKSREPIFLFLGSILWSSASGPRSKPGLGWYCSAG